MKEVNNLLERLGELEDAPLIWINKKVYDMAQEIKRLKEEYMMLQNASDEVEEEKDKEIEKLNTIIEIKTNRIQDLMSRLSKRQDRIDKAIECIDDELLVFGDETQWEDWEVRKYVFKALDILRGSDKEK